MKEHFFESESVKAHWGLIPLPSVLPQHEPEVVTARGRFENLMHPVCHTIVNLKV
jgi:hypothetical protein